MCRRSTWSCHVFYPACASDPVYVSVASRKIYNLDSLYYIVLFSCFSQSGLYVFVVLMMLWWNFSGICSNYWSGLNFSVLGYFNLRVIGAKNRVLLAIFRTLSWRAQFIAHWQLFVVYRQPVPMREWIIGAFINILGSIAINFGTNLLKLGHDEVNNSFPICEDLSLSTVNWSI